MPGVRSALIVALVLGLGFVSAGAACSWWLARHGDDLLWLGGGPAKWIVAPVTPRLGAQQPDELTTTFERSFDPAPGVTTLEVRALGRATVTLNGRVVASPGDFPGGWKETLRVDVTAALRPGTNTVRVTVLAAGSPAALNLALGGSGTDETWVASIAGSTARPARLATDHPRLDPGLPGTAGKRPLGALAASLPTLGLLVALSSLLVFAAARRARFPAIAVGVAGLAWVALYWNNAGAFPETTGFDAQGHLDYIRYLLDEGGIPLANRGWQMYQPPLFYVVCAAVLRLFGDGAFDAGILRAVTFGAGLAQVLLLGATARLLWPARPIAHALALGFGACLPMHLYLFHFVSNETLAMALNSLVSYLVLRLLVRAGPPSLRACVGLGACLGLAMLAKFSAVVLLPPALGAVAYLLYKHGDRRATGVARLVAAAAACAVVCGWHFARVWAEFGNPLIGNWDPSLGFAWWQDPGFRTIADYTSFGRSLGMPWFAGIAGVLDGAYSTLWGDALASGAMEVQYGAPWNHRLVSAGYVLSLLPTGAALVGGAVGAGRLLGRRLGAARRGVAVYLVALAAIVVAALGYMTVLVPSYAQSKAFYIQPAMTALCVAFVFGTLRLLDLLGRYRAILTVALAVCGMTYFASVWVRPEAPAAKTQRGWYALATRDAGAAEAYFREALERDPDHPGALTGLAVVHAGRERWDEAAEAARVVLANLPAEDHPRLAARALNAAALADLAAGNLEDAERSLRRGIELAPSERQNYRPLVRLLLTQNRTAEAVEVLRDELWVAPRDRNIHRLLSDLSRRRP